jgi:hypothetical protein
MISPEEYQQYASIENIKQVINAFEKGEIIEMYVPENNKWLTCGDTKTPYFNFADRIYRVKPPRQPMPDEPIAVHTMHGWELAIFKNFDINNISVFTSVLNPETGAVVKRVYRTWKFITDEQAPL